MLVSHSAGLGIATKAPSAAFGPAKPSRRGCALEKELKLAYLRDHDWSLQVTRRALSLGRKDLNLEATE